MNPALWCLLIVVANALLFVAGIAAACRCGLWATIRPCQVTAICAAGCLTQCAAFLASHGNAFSTAEMVIVCSTATICAATDLAVGYIFDLVTLPAMTALGVLALSNGAVTVCITGAAALGGSLGALHLFSGGRAMGLGDAKLSACIGAAFGYAGFLGLAIAFVCGGVPAAIKLLKYPGARGTRVPFAPYLAIGTYVLAFAPAFK